MELYVNILFKSLARRVQKADIAVPPADADNYDKVKAAFLKTFTLVPEWYRQEFRNMRPGTDLSQVEFFKLLSLTFDRCMASS